MKIRLAKKRLKRFIAKTALLEDGVKLEKRLRHRFTIKDIAIYNMVEKEDGFPYARISIRIKSKRKRGKHED